jgi:hypothetical protein
MQLKAKITEDAEIKSKIVNLQELVAGYEELVKLGYKYVVLNASNLIVDIAHNLRL